MNIVSNTVAIQTEEKSMPAYLYEPDAVGTRPGILLLMEAYGVTEHIKEVAQRLAKEGYTVLVPNLYHRDFPSITFDYTERVQAMDAMDKVDISKAVQDAKAGLDYLRALPHVERVGTVGLCFGGSLLLPLSSACGSAIDVAASFYGHCNHQWLDAIEDNVTAPMIFFYGNLDSVFLPPDIDALDAKLRELGKNYEIKRYDNAGHAFFNDKRLEYNQEVADACWKDLMAFLSKHLGLSHSFTMPATALLV